MIPNMGTENTNRLWCWMKLGGAKYSREAGLYRIAKQFNLCFREKVPIKEKEQKRLDRRFFLGL